MYFSTIHYNQSKNCYFARRKSQLIAILKLIRTLYNNKGYVNVTVYSDFTMALDKIDYGVLLHKLTLFGFDPAAIKLFLNHT